MKVEEIMVKDVVTIAPEENTLTAAQRMLERCVGCLLVAVDQAVKGIVTDRDLLYCIRSAHDPRQCKVSAHMSRPVVMERPHEDLLVAAEVMMRNGIKRLPILEDGRIVGIVSFSDIARVAHEMAKNFWSTGVAVTSLVRALALYRSRKK
ncbi:MAG TPA: CBS domain-containing protein [Candidatus Acidoferrales bacterium]|nr:CBS domain-containing protein [Candidatus Acidoferrales bacterium]